MNIRSMVLTAGGLGLCKPAPGTWGSLPPVMLAFSMACLLPREAQWMIAVSVGLMGLCFSIACVKFGSEAEELFGCKDPSEVVADEVAGQSIALLLLQIWGFGGPEEIGRNAVCCLIAFASFRVFDITKLWPANSLQRLKLGWGVLVDDLVAGVYALIVTTAVVWFAY